MSGWIDVWVAACVRWWLNDYMDSYRDATCIADWRGRLEDGWVYIITIIHWNVII